MTFKITRSRRAVSLGLGSAFLAVLAGSGCGDDGTGKPPLTVVSEDPSNLPLRGLNADEMVRFDEGDALFDKRFLPVQGLGPLYIRANCAACHADDARGPGAVSKMAPGPGGVELPYGTTERTQLAGGATMGIVAPDGAEMSLRVGPAVFGRGYIEAIADSEIERMEREQAAAGVVSGRINRVTFYSVTNPDTRFHQYQTGQANLIGRFGLKARIASVDEFSADAFQGDMGLTSPLRPTELPNPEGLTDDDRPGLDVSVDEVNTVADYVRSLALPRRAPADAAAVSLFTSAGCAACHVPSLRTRADYPLAPLAGIDAPVYSDLLVHDMGAALADGIADGSASGSEWRTAPLMGLRFFRSFLHDGRAKTLREAVTGHAGDGSEANASVAAFQALAAAEQQKLLDFVGSL